MPSLAVMVSAAGVVVSVAGVRGALARKFGLSLVYTAVTWYTPAGSISVLMLAVPPLNVTGEPLAELSALTTAVKEAAWP